MKSGMLQAGQPHTAFQIIGLNFGAPHSLGFPAIPPRGRPNPSWDIQSRPPLIYLVSIILFNTSCPHLRLFANLIVFTYPTNLFNDRKMDF